MAGFLILSSPIVSCILWTVVLKKNKDNGILRKYASNNIAISLFYPLFIFVQCFQDERALTNMEWLRLNNGMALFINIFNILTMIVYVVKNKSLSTLTQHLKYIMISIFSTLVFISPLLILSMLNLKF